MTMQAGTYGAPVPSPVREAVVSDLRLALPMAFVRCWLGLASGRINSDYNRSHTFCRKWSASVGNGAADVIVNGNEISSRETDRLSHQSASQRSDVITTNSGFPATASRDGDSVKTATPTSDGGGHHCNAEHPKMHDSTASAELPAELPAAEVAETKGSPEVVSGCHGSEPLSSESPAVVETGVRAGRNAITGENETVLLLCVKLKRGLLLKDGCLDIALTDVQTDGTDQAASNEESTDNSYCDGQRKDSLSSLLQSEDLAEQAPPVNKRKRGRPRKTVASSVSHPSVKTASCEAIGESKETISSEATSGKSRYSLRGKKLPRSIYGFSDSEEESEQNLQYTEDGKENICADFVHSSVSVGTNVHEMQEAGAEVSLRTDDAILHRNTDVERENNDGLQAVNSGMMIETDGVTEQVNGNDQVSAASAVYVDNNHISRFAACSSESREVVIETKTHLSDTDLDSSAGIQGTESKGTGYKNAGSVSVLVTSHEDSNRNEQTSASHFSQTDNEVTSPKHPHSYYSRNTGDRPLSSMSVLQSAVRGRKKKSRLILGGVPGFTRRKRNNKKSASCKFCQRRFCDYTGVSVHAKKFHGDEEGLDRYLQNLKKLERVQCAVCGLECEDRFRLQQHEDKVHFKAGEFPCSHCGKVFAHTVALKTHIRAVHMVSGRPHECPKCPARFKWAATLKQHMQEIHQGVRSLACPVCGKTFFRRSQLNRHSMVHASEERKLACSVCGRRFGFLNNLQRHMAIVHDKPDQEKFHCSYCGKGFTRRAGLISHVEKVHFSMYPYQCTICKDRFPRSAALEKHMAVQHNDTDYKAPEGRRSHFKYHRTVDDTLCCRVCNKNFFYKAKLVEHVHAAHGDTFPFHCDQCGQGFLEQDFLTLHSQQAHGILLVCVNAESSLIADGELNPLMLTTPSAQLRGGRSEHKRVNNSIPLSPAVPSTQLSGGHGRAKLASLADGDSLEREHQIITSVTKPEPQSGSLVTRQQHPTFVIQGSVLKTTLPASSVMKSETYIAQGERATVSLKAGDSDLEGGKLFTGSSSLQKTVFVSNGTSISESGPVIIVTNPPHQGLAEEETVAIQNFDSLQTAVIADDGKPDVTVQTFALEEGKSMHSYSRSSDEIVSNENNPSISLPSNTISTTASMPSEQSLVMVSDSTDLGVGSDSSGALLLGDVAQEMDVVTETSVLPENCYIIQVEDGDSTVQFVLQNSTGSTAEPTTEDIADLLLVADQSAPESPQVIIQGVTAQEVSGDASDSVMEVQ